MICDSFDDGNGKILIKYSMSAATNVSLVLRMKLLGHPEWVSNFKLGDIQRFNAGFN